MYTALRTLGICQLVLATIICTINPSIAYSKEKIRRWPVKRQEVGNMTMHYDVKPNIFQDYKWTSPDVKSHQVDLAKGKVVITYAGTNYTMEVKDNTIVISNGSGFTASASRQTSNQYYYDITKVKLVPHTVSRSVPHTEYRSTPTVVTHTRSVTHYTYNSSTHSSQPTYSTESYTTTEYHSQAYTSWRYETSTTYVLDVPTTNVYVLKLANDENMVVYEQEEKDGKQYYYQNPTYLIGSDDNDTKYLLVDANSNGNYFDPEDKIMINTWNPFVQGSVYRTSNIYKENKWVALDYLKRNMFMEAVKGTANTIQLRNENDVYMDDDKEGKVTFNNMPDEYTLTINSRRYKVKAKHPDLKSEYGKFRAEISEPGHLPYEFFYTVNDQTPDVVLTYKQMPFAGELTVSNIFTSGYFITVKGANNYLKQYTNTNTFSVPTGKVTIEIDNNGFTFSKDVDVEAGKSVTINYEEEIKKLLPENKDTKPEEVEKAKAVEEKK